MQLCSHSKCVFIHTEIPRYQAHAFWQVMENYFKAIKYIMKQRRLTGSSQGNVALSLRYKLLPFCDTRQS